MIKYDRDKGNYIVLPSSPDEIRRFGEMGLQDSVHIHAPSLNHPPLTRDLGEALRVHCKAEELYLGCGVTRAALSRISLIEGLTRLHFDALTGPGVSRGFEHATHLKEVRVLHDVKVKDARAMLRAPALTMLGVQYASVSLRLIQDMATHATLKEVDLEGSGLDDDMAAVISTSQSIQTLHLGDTRLTRRGLLALTKMHQLTSLDLWACRLDDDDLDLLRAMPQLESITLGSASSNYDVARMHALLIELPNLRRVWLDGVEMPDEMADTLRQRLEYFRLDGPR